MAGTAWRDFAQENGIAHAIEVLVIGDAVAQLQKPILARRYSVTSTPQSEALQRNAFPLPHWSIENGHVTSCHTGVATAMAFAAPLFMLQ